MADEKKGKERRDRLNDNSNESAHCDGNCDCVCRCDATVVSSPARVVADRQFQGVGVTAAASTPQDVDKVPLDHPEMSPVATCPKGQLRCGAGCYDPNQSCCWSSKEGPYIVRKPRKRTTN